MDVYNESSSFDHYFYPILNFKKSKWQVALLLFVVFVAVMQVFWIVYDILQNYSNIMAAFEKGSAWLYIVKAGVILLLVVMIGFPLFILVGLLYMIIRSRKIFVGIDKDGVFIRYAGLIPWREIDSIELKPVNVKKRRILFSLHKKKGKFICITTKKKQTLVKQESFFKNLYKKIFDRSRKTAQGDVIIKEYDIDWKIPLEDVLKVLKEYKNKYAR